MLECFAKLFKKISNNPDVNAGDDSIQDLSYENELLNLELD